MIDTGQYVLFDGRAKDDRLGAHCLHILICIVIAHKLDVGIHFDESYRFYSNTIFMKTLFKYISFWNTSRPKKNLTKVENVLVNYNPKCNYSIYHAATLLCESDIMSYYKKNIQTTMMIFFVEFELEGDYEKKNRDTINKVSNENTTSIHLRLDDLEYHTFDYDSIIPIHFFENRVFTEGVNSKSISVLFHSYILKHIGVKQCKNITRKYSSVTPVFSYMGQSITDSKNIQTILDNNLSGNNNIVITSPSGEVKLDNIPYSRISSTQEVDLYILCKTSNLILSRSTYSLVSLFFNTNINNVWVHDWGVTLSMGLNTKYDKTNYNYY